MTGLLLAVGLSVASLELESLFSAIAIGLALMVNGYSEMYLSVFRSFERMRIVSILMITQRVLFFIFGLSVLLSGGDVALFSYAFLLVAVVLLIVTRFQMSVKQKLKKTTHDGQLTREILRTSLPICGLILFTYIYFRIDAVLIFFLRGKLKPCLC